MHANAQHFGLDDIRIPPGSGRVAEVDIHPALHHPPVANRQKPQRQRVWRQAVFTVNGQLSIQDKLRGCCCLNCGIAELGSDVGGVWRGKVSSTAAPHVRAREAVVGPYSHPCWRGCSEGL